MIALLLFAAGLVVFGLARKQPPRYWQHAVAALAVQFVLIQLLKAGGTVEDPSGDGAVTAIVRRATGDGPLMGIWALFVIVVAWWVPLAVAYEGYDPAWCMRAGKPPTEPVRPHSSQIAVLRASEHSVIARWRRWARWVWASAVGMGMLAIGWVFVAGSGAVGRVAGREAAKAFIGNSSDYETDEMLRGLRDAGIGREDVERLARTLPPSEFRRMGALGTVALDPAEQYEIIVYRTTAVEAAPVSICASEFWHGFASTPGNVLVRGLSSEQNARLKYLVGLGVGRVLRGDTAIVGGTITEQEWVDILIRHGSSEALDAIAAATSPTDEPLADATACAAARALYRTVRDIPSLGPDRARAVHYLLRGTSNVN